MKLAGSLLCLAAAVCAEDGLPPRSLGDYPVHTESAVAELGATLLTPEQARKLFVSDLNRGYVVVEVGVYPRQEIDIRQSAFNLRVGGTLERPVSPKVIAGVLQKTAPSSRDVTVYPSVGVGYERWPGGGGWTTSTGVGVGVGSPGPPPASTDADRRTMEQELSDRQLPDGLSAKPVAGYLYFAAPSRKRGEVLYELEYSVSGQRMTLTFPRPAGKKP